jgi:RNA polymerase sigma-70 factor (ECF subfamily)
VSETLTDLDLLRLTRQGNQDAFLALYRRHEGAVFRFALHMSGKRDIAEEVTQEVFTALLKRGDLYVAESGSSLEAYLIGAARNQVRRHLHQLRMTQRERGLESALSEPVSPFLETVDRKQELALLRRAILSLPFKYREAVVLCDLEELDYETAARRMGCALGTVRSRLHRARAILAAKLRRRDRCPA